MTCHSPPPQKGQLCIGHIYFCNYLLATILSVSVHAVVLPVLVFLCPCYAVCFFFLICFLIAWFIQGRSNLTVNIAYGTCFLNISLIQVLNKFQLSSAPFSWLAREDYFAEHKYIQHVTVYGILYIFHFKY